MPRPDHVKDKLWHLTSMDYVGLIDRNGLKPGQNQCKYAEIWKTQTCKTSFDILDGTRPSHAPLRSKSVFFWPYRRGTPAGIIRFTVDVNKIPKDCGCWRAPFADADEVFGEVSTKYRGSMTDTKFLEPINVKPRSPFDSLDSAHDVAKLYWDKASPVNEDFSNIESDDEVFCPCAIPKEALVDD